MAKNDTSKTTLNTVTDLPRPFVISRILAFSRAYKKQKNELPSLELLRN